MRVKLLIGTVALCQLLAFANSCQRTSSKGVQARVSIFPSPTPTAQPLPRNISPQLTQMLEGAVAQNEVTSGYDPAYVKIDYPNGDVSMETGVCSDVVVRAFRKAGIDLQKDVHEDMIRAWDEYPKKWGARGTDTNIDHRRVLNLTTYFSRHGKALTISDDRNDYQPGDIVAWQLSDGVEHIGILTNLTAGSENHYLIIHNIGSGARLEDVLFGWKIIGHYRYFKS
jgi:uncharacterized protein